MVTSEPGRDWKARLRKLGLGRKRRPRPTAAGPRRAATTPVGRAGEELAASYLEARGVTIVGRNFRTPGGELDLVGETPGALLFVEVRRRRNAARGGAAESVTSRKRDRLVRAARRWLVENPPRGREIRFDVIAIEDEPFRIDWIHGAFDATS